MPNLKPTVDNLKVGAKVKCITVNKSHHSDMTVGEIYEVLSFDSDEFTIKDDNKDSHDFYYDDDGDSWFELVGKTLDTLEAGDIVIDDEDEEYLVIAAIGYIVALSKELDLSLSTLGQWISIQRMAKEGWKVKGEEEEVEELTMDEVCKRIGKKVKIVKDKA